MNKAKPQTKLMLDKLDRALIEQLQNDGRISNRELASELKANEATIANRLKRLEEQSVCRVTAIMDMQKLDFSELLFATLRTAGRPITQVGEELAMIDETIAVTLSTGQFDLVVALLARDRGHLSTVMGSHMNRIRGIEQLQAHLALKVYKYESRWARLGADHPVTPKPLPGVHVDELDLKIIQQLQDDARESNRKIASRLDVSEGTIRSRIRRMQDDKTIRIQAISDVEAFGLYAHAYVGIQSDGTDVDKLAKRLARLSNIAVLIQTVGSFDLMAVVYTTDHLNLIDTILNQIAITPGVRRTETMESCGTTKHCYTWGKVL